MSSSRVLFWRPRGNLILLGDAKLERGLRLVESVGSTADGDGCCRGSESDTRGSFASSSVPRLVLERFRPTPNKNPTLHPLRHRPQPAIAKDLCLLDSISDT
ncbi:hypothetical protein B296_00004351 [Ensete ventricosum]|uniref:Uncharacterized protein n=1 Tax=Ensete ventricosum TaxID=4639 RepID=A0A426YM83_ENSVE|nr:hypothetical protein B296_00004351 [Ensete ventricosum]